MHIADRRLNPSSKSLENRKALVQQAVCDSSRGCDIPDILHGGEDGVDEPPFHRAPGGGTGTTSMVDRGV
jgi:uncharacterized protein